MSYLHEMTVVSDSVAKLLTSREALDPSETDLALAGHSALVQTVREIASDIVHVSVDPERYGVPTLDRHPAALFERQISRHVQIRTEKVSTLLEVAPSTVKGQAWQTTLIASTSALADWKHLPISMRPMGDDVWSHLADLAETAQALTHLDLDLAKHLALQGREPEAAKLRLAARSGLAIAAREVTYLAGGGQLPHVQDLSRSNLRVLPKPQPADLPEALSRMSHRLASGGPTSPRAVMAALMATTMSAEAAAVTLDAAGLTPTADRLRGLVKDLKFVQRLSDYVTTLGPTTPASLEQSRQIQQLLTDMRRRKQTLPLLDALATAKELPTSLARVRDAVDHQLRIGHWYVARDYKGLAHWGQADMKGSPSVVLERLQAVATRAEGLSRVLHRVHPHAVPPPAPAPRDILQAALRRRGPPPRPGLPGLARYLHRGSRT